MQQKLLRKAGLLGIILTAAGVYLAGCIDEPNQPLPPRMKTTVRWVHGSAGQGALDLWIDGVKQTSFSNATFQYASPYDPNVNAGNRQIAFTTAGAPDTNGAIFRKLVSFRSFMKTTVVFWDNNGEPDILVTQERFTYADELKALGDTAASIKLINVNNLGTAVQLMRDDASGLKLVGPVNPGTLSPYTMLKTGAMKMFVTQADGTEVMNLDFTVQPKTRYSFILAGDLANPVLLRLTDDPS